jgi:hypothetical protein
VAPNALKTDILFPSLDADTEQKVLKIAPTEGMKIDKDGILVWVPSGEEF